MSSHAETLFSDPSVQFLQKLLDDVSKGNIILPRFQRPFVWDKERRRSLFDSVRKGIPIGSLMIWETSSQKSESEIQIVSKVELGPFRLPKLTESGARRYLLDGEQRLMTLYFALHNPEMVAESTLENEGSEKPDAFEVFFDLDEKNFVMRDELVEGPTTRHFPLRDIFVPRGILKFQRKLEAELENEGAQTGNKIDEKKLNDLFERSDSVAEAILRYKIPVTVLSTNDLELVTETFKRVNSQGVSMSEAHMMNAVAWRKDFDLLEELDELRESIEKYPHWQRRENLDNDMLLRVAKRLLNRGAYEEDASGIAPQLRDGKVLQRVSESMKRCATFLGDRGLRNPSHVPNVIMLIILGRVFDEVPRPTSDALHRLEDWLWYTSYAEAFGGFVRGSVYEALEKQALDIVGGRQPKCPVRIPSRQPIPRHNFLSARSRTLAWMLARRMMKHDGGQAADVLAEFGSAALVRLVTPPKSVDLASKSALRVLASPVEIDLLRGKLKGDGLDSSFTDAQVISDKALAELQRNERDVRRFVEIREKDLNKMEETKFKEVIKNLFPGQ